jgi:hypothetical protein
MKIRSHCAALFASFAVATAPMLTAVRRRRRRNGRKRRQTQNEENAEHDRAAGASVNVVEEIEIHHLEVVSILT